jgi:hypothetical protein
MTVTTAREQFEADGFCFAPQLLSAEGVAEMNAVCDRIIECDYATGVAPHEVSWRPGDDPSRLVKIDQPQRADHAMSTLLEASGVGEFAASLFDASLVQVWAVQLLHKPPIAAAAAAAAGNVVGWHQDEDYWHEWWDGEVFTCWLALTDVAADCGPMSFVPRSHQWGFLKSGDFFQQDLAAQRTGIPVPDGETWAEVPAILGPGEASFHHRRTVHGSGVNTADRPRRSLAIHLRTERSAPMNLAPPGYAEELDDPRICPALWRT